MATDNMLNKGQLDQAATVLSRNPDKAIQEMMETIDALRAVYRDENDALKRSDSKAFVGLQDRKIRIAREYQNNTQQLLERKAEFSGASPALRKRLLDAHQEFTTLAAENMAGLERMRKSVQRLGDRIMSAARDAARKNTPNYGSSGNLNTNTRSVSISLNESA